METAEKQRIENIIESFRKTHSAPWVARKASKEASGGLLDPKTMSNRDSAGTGIEGIFYVGRCACYPTDKFIEFLKREAGV
jgi:hypothetical protein